MNLPATPYGVVAQFDGPDDLVAAARAARAAGYRRVEAYSPYPIEEVEEVLPMRNSLPAVVLLAGVTGALLGYLLQYWISAIHYPLNIGGRPLNSWPAFIVITFELTILFAASAAFFGFLYFAGFPAPYHPLFRIPQFKHASSDGFFLAIEARDETQEVQISRFLHSLGPSRVWEVEHD